MFKTLRSLSRNGLVAPTQGLLKSQALQKCLRFQKRGIAVPAMMPHTDVPAVAQHDPQSYPPLMIVTDMAGTTVNEQGLVYTTLHNTIENYGLPIKSGDIDNWHGASKHEVLEHFLKRAGKDTSSHRAAITADFDSRLLRAYSSGNISLIDPRLPEYFNYLRHVHGIRMALNTGYSSKIQNVIIKSLHMDTFVDDWVSSQDVAVGRPHPYMIDELRRRAPWSCVDVIKVGDTRNDVLEGINAGCIHSIGVLTGSDSRETLENAGASYVLESVMDLDLVL